MKWWLLILLAAGMIDASAEPLKYLELSKSKPVEVNGLEFVAATQSQWIIHSPEENESVEVQLLITNKSGHDLIFRTFDTFTVQLKNANGTQIRPGGGRDGTMYSPSVVIPAGDTYCLSRRDELLWDYSTNNSPITRAFDYWDGTGSVATFGLHNLGHYTLSFGAFSSQKDSDRESQRLGGLPVWTGTAQTKEVPFEIIGY